MTTAPATNSTQLEGSFSLVQIFALAFGSIIGVGWIMVLGVWLDQAGSVGAMLAFLVGGVAMLVIALCYAEVASIVPVTGGEAAYARQLFGRAAGFFAGWLLAFTYLAVGAFEAISTGWIVGVLAPALKGPAVYSMLGAEVHLGEITIGAAGLLAITVANFYGGSVAGSLQNLTTYALLVVATIFIGAGVLLGDPANLEPAFIQPHPFVGFAAVLGTAPFWFAGFNAAVQAIGERREGASINAIGWLLVGALGAAILFYCGVIAAASMAAPRAELLAADLPAAVAFEAAFNSPVMRNVVLFTGLLGIISTWNAVFIAASRVLYALALDGWLPAGLAKRHLRSGAPSRAVLTAAAIMFAGIFIGRGAIELAVNSSAICLAAMFTLVSCAAFKARMTGMSASAPFRVPGGKAMILLAIALSFVIFTLSILQPAFGRQLPPAEWVVLAVWGVIGIAVFAFNAKTSARKVNNT